MWYQPGPWHHIGTVWLSHAVRCTLAIWYSMLGRSIVSQHDNGTYCPKRFLPQYKCGAEGGICRLWTFLPNITCYRAKCTTCTSTTMQNAKCKRWWLWSLPTAFLMMLQAQVTLFSDCSPWVTNVSHLPFTLSTAAQKECDKHWGTFNKYCSNCTQLWEDYWLRIAAWEE